MGILHVQLHFQSCSIKWFVCVSDHREEQIALYDALQDELTWRRPYSSLSFWPGMSRIGPYNVAVNTLGHLTDPKHLI